MPNVRQPPDCFSCTRYPIPSLSHSNTVTKMLPVQWYNTHLGLPFNRDLFHSAQLVPIAWKCMACSYLEYTLATHTLIQVPQVLPSLTMFSVTPLPAVWPQLRISLLRRSSSCRNLTSLHQWYPPDHHRLHWMVRTMFQRICSSKAVIALFYGIPDAP